MTIEEFVHFTELLKNADRRFELINGEIIEMPPGRVTNSMLHDAIVFLAWSHCRSIGLSCYTCSADGTFVIRGNSVVSDFAYMTEPPTGKYPESAQPIWIVEIVSPTDEPLKIRDKRNVYLAAKIVYLEMYPEDKSADVYRPGIEVQTFGMNDSIDLGDVIARFKLVLKDVFRN